MPNKLTQVHLPDDDAMHRNSDAPAARAVNQAAVLIPLVHHREQWQVLFIRRASNDRDRHSGQVAFPGGRLEHTDSSHEAAALRETHEEIGVDPSRVNVLGKIAPYITVSDYQVTPIVGIVHWPTTLSLQSSEVARAFLIPLEWLKARDNLPFARAQRWMREARSTIRLSSMKNSTARPCGERRPA